MAAKKKLVSKWVELARERQARDLREGKARGLRYSPERAERAVRFFREYCRFTKGEWAGQPFTLEPWQENDVIRPLFGWEREDGTRRFRTAYEEIPRKNGKSEKAAATALYLTAADQEPGAEVYSSATKKDQARIVHDTATQMVRLSPPLKRFCKVYRHNIHVPALGSKFEPLGADSNTLDGLNPHGNIVDELHAHKDRRVWDVLITAMGARRQPLTVAITTAGIYNPASIGWEQHEYAQKVLEGVFEDDSFFAFIACADPDDDWQSPAVWEKANPNYGVSVKPEYLRDLAGKAERQPSFLNSFLRYHLNIWTQQIDRWIPMEKWDALPATANRAALAGRPCFAGLDLSSTRDLTAFKLLFRDDDGMVSWLSWYWVPEDTVIERSRDDNVPYDAWVRDGWMQTTPGNVVDYDTIRRDVNEIGKQFNIREIAIDRWNSTGLQTQLAGDGFTVVPFGQGYVSMSAPAKELEKLIVSGRLTHDGNPVTRWQFSHVGIEEDPAGNIKPSKKVSRERIDGVVAGTMALGRMLVNAEEGPSVYDERGIVFV